MPSVKKQNIQKYEIFKKQKFSKLINCVDKSIVRKPASKKIDIRRKIFDALIETGLEVNLIRKNVLEKN